MALAAFLPVLGPLVDKILDLIPDPNARARAEAEYQSALLAAVVQESADNREINKTEAAHDSVFVSGWRPFIGWICGLAVAFQYLVRPFWIWAAAVWFPDAPVPPGLDGVLWELMFGMLGIGGLRTVEKLKGKAG
ncbi:MAG: holin family protein [Desulfovibrio sp.]|jgi:hypothetical protein|nr:holin family protein [Desulfovibrio sp.]